MFLKSEAQSLEDSFFLEQDRKIAEQLQKIEKMQENKEALRAISGITNDHILDKLVELDVKPKVLAAMTIVPLIQVACADGEVDEEERKALLSLMEKHGIQDGSVGHEMLESWLCHRPEPKLFQAWTHYIAGLCKELSPDERTELRLELLDDAQTIAESSGGFLGIGKISQAEKETMTMLKASFDCTN